MTSTTDSPLLAPGLHTIDPDLTLVTLEGGTGRPVLVLHGGGGPLTVLGLATDLARDHRVIAPTHPGWDGTDRPDWLDSVDELALTYTRLLADLDLRDVVVVGSSLGGWVAAELAVRDSAACSGRIGRLLLVDAVGIEVPEEPMTDFFALDARGVAEHSFHDSERFYVDPATLPQHELARRAANMTTMAVLAKDPYMHDPRLRRRLARVATATTLVWGDSDGIVTPAYGRAYAAAFANARFELVEAAGHLPQLEQPEATLAVIRAAIGA